MRISTAGNKRHFTLIELVAAITIIALVSGLAVASLRGESPAQLLERTALDFQAYCARIRYLAAERGEEYSVLYDPDETEGGIYAVPASSLDKEESLDGFEKSTEEQVVKIRFPLNEKFRIETADNAVAELANGTELEIFRFFPDGSGAGGHSLTLQYGELQKSFSLSRLTGRLLIEEKEP